MKNINVHPNEKVVKGNESHGIVPWKVVDLEGKDFYVFSEGVAPDNVEDYEDLYELYKAGAKVDIAGHWPDDVANAVIENF